MLSFIIGSFVFSAFDIDFQSSIGLAASTLGNVGPALGSFGPNKPILHYLNGDNYGQVF